MPKILPGYGAALSALTPVLHDLPGRVVAIDGRDGVGKTTLGRYLAWHFNVSLIETDLFLVPNQSHLVYRDNEIGRLIYARLKKPRPVIIEGVSILRLLQRLNMPPDFLIYVRNPSKSGSRALADDLSDYNNTFMPEAKADVVLAIEYGDG